MKKIFKVAFLFFFILKQGFSQEKILITDRQINTSKDLVQLCYGVQKGDKIVVNLNVIKDKDVDYVKIYTDKILFEANNITRIDQKEFIMSDNSFFNVDIIGTNTKLASRDVDVKIERIPANIDGKYFNTNLQQFKKYVTSTIEYKTDSVIGYQKPELRPKTFKVLANVDYETVTLIEKKLNIKGLQKKHVSIEKPKDSILTENKEMILMGYQIIITSAAGAQAMWKAIGVGIDVASMFLSPAAGLAAGTAFDMIGPQEGGEPIMFYIMNKEEELAKFLDQDINTRPMVNESGLITNMSSTWSYTRDPKLFIGLENLNLASEVDVSVVVSAIYQAVTYQNITQDQIIIRPETIKLNKQIQKIENVKYYDFQH